MGFWPSFKTTETPDKFVGFMAANNTCTCMSFRLGIWYKIIFVNM